jgi:hypothetical protein
VDLGQRRDETSAGKLLSQNFENILNKTVKSIGKIGGRVEVSFNAGFAALRVQYENICQMGNIIRTFNGLLRLSDSTSTHFSTASCVSHIVANGEQNFLLRLPPCCNLNMTMSRLSSTTRDHILTVRTQYQYSIPVYCRRQTS